MFWHISTPQMISFSKSEPGLYSYFIFKCSQFSLEFFHFQAVFSCNHVEAWWHVHQQGLGVLTKTKQQLQAMSNQSSLIACLTRTTKNDISCKFHSLCHITPAASNLLLQASQCTSLIAHSKCGDALQKKSQTPNKILLKLLLTQKSALQTFFTARYFCYLIQTKNKQILEEPNEIFCCKLGKWRVMIKEEFPPRIHKMQSWESNFSKFSWGA